MAIYDHCSALYLRSVALCSGGGGDISALSKSKREYTTSQRFAISESLNNRD